MRVLLLIVGLAALAAVATAKHYTFNDPNMPITVVDTSRGQDNRERIDHLEAHILNKHLTKNKRVNFPTSGPLERYYKGVRADGDERGHLVGSQFSGPPTWYNLSPQNARVNRNLDYQSITTDWYNTECEARKFLEKGPDREVHWVVDMTYVRDSNRPDEYHLKVDFLHKGRSTGKPIDAKIRNPFEKQDSTFWICRGCKSNRGHLEGCKRA